MSLFSARCAPWSLISIPRVLALTWLPRVAFVSAIALAATGACRSGGCDGCPSRAPRHVPTLRS